MDLLGLELKYKNNQDVLELIETVKELQQEVKNNNTNNLINNIENSLEETNSYLRDLKNILKSGVKQWLGKL